MGKLDGKVALVAGGGRGVGRAIALAFAQAGAKVAIAEIDEESATATVSEITERGGEAVAIDCDLSIRFDVRAAVAYTAHRFGQIDILVNPVQSPPPGVPFQRVSEDELDFAWSIGLIGTFRLMKASFPFLQQRGGVVLNLCAGDPTVGQRSAAAAALHGALRGLTEAAASEWAAHGIGLHYLCPGGAEAQIEQEALRLVSSDPVLQGSAKEAH